MISESHKKIISSTLIIFMVLSLSATSFIYKPKIVNAQTAAACPPPLCVPTNDIPNNMKEGIFDMIAWTLVNVILSQISASIVNWINSGFEGSPTFVTDFKGFLTNIFDEELGRFIQGSELGFLCSPFEFDIRFSLALSFQKPFKDSVSCTLTGVIDNIDGFVSGDFFQGGWEGWFEMTTKPQNNPYGAFLLADAEIKTRIREKQERELFKVDLGDGFLSIGTCLASDSDGNCLSSQIELPGSVIEAQLNNTLATGQQKLVVADEFNEIVVALLSQLVQKVLFEGLLGASGSSGGSSSYTYQLANPDISTEFGEAKEGALDAVNRSIDGEESYKSTKEETLDMVIAEEQLLIQLRRCYRLNGSGDTRSIDRIIQNQIEPLKESLNADIVDAQLVIDKLNLIKVKIADASTLDEIADLINEMREIVTNEIIDAYNEQLEVTTQLNNLDTQQKLRRCQRYD